jgi:hypothetical protein
MKLRNLLAAGAALTLMACGGSESADNAATTAEAAANGAEATPAANAAESTANATAAAAPAAGAAPTKEYLLGAWGEDGNCELPITFKADGTMDGPVDRWELNGAVLTMVGLPQTFTLSVIDEKTMESRAGGTDEPHKLTRC